MEVSHICSLFLDSFQERRDYNPLLVRCVHMQGSANNVYSLLLCAPTDKMKPVAHLAWGCHGCHGLAQGQTEAYSWVLVMEHSVSFAAK
jgi:hypothetical protein